MRGECVGVAGEGIERDDNDQEDDRQPGQQDVERDLVRRLLPLSAFDQGDHPVEKGLARLGGDPNHQLIGDDLGAAGDRRGDVSARLLEHRRRFAGDRRLGDIGDSLDHLAVAGDRVAGLDQNEVAEPELRRGALSRSRSGRRSAAWRGFRCGFCAGYRPGPCRDLPPSPRRSWRRAP